MTAFEKIETGMRLMAEGCEEAKSCSNCPYEKLCERMPSSWLDSTFEDDEEVDYDWGYNEDMGYDPYEGCYTWDC